MPKEIVLVVPKINQDLSLDYVERPRRDVHTCEMTLLSPKKTSKLGKKRRIHQWKLALLG